ncbi:putative 5'-3' exonuclease 20 [Tupanvirus deep ocean]|uniref:5'-3' exonuclease 20 n=2 Tax=Tupanvirus TaxID=2094720 RepID=A0AC62A7H4_9VIRU|nr:putative 5'-3' exonuclease 20 [Tupanvirus deep ocean]QKU33737.1 putative 5'-3' exonuclease 20 [Tupanvirus deep ocean]
MGVLRLMGTILKHPATKDALIENVPVVECLLIDYNANIHYVLQKTITQLNEILYYTYHRENNIKHMLMVHNLEQNEYNLDLELSIEDIEDLIERFDDDYGLGKTYNEIHKNLMSGDKISDIIFHETINYTRVLICSLNKGWIKKVYIALDGTPSMAKIKEQRNRRYIGAHLNNIKEDIVKKYKLKNNKIYQIDLFYYRSMICAGTKFMDKIQQALFHLDINLDVEVSTLNTKGEGEKKIIHTIETPEYSSYNSYCIMSPDSDMLILIGMLSNNEKFNGKKLYNFRIDYQRKNQYQFFDLKQLVENFQNYFSKKIGKEISMEKMLDLFFMLVVFGNDFLPKLEPLDITQHFDFVCEICLKLSTSGIHFVDNGKLNYKYLLEFFKMINNEIIQISIEQSLNTKYNNYHKLCKQISITEDDIIKCQYHHNDVKPFKVNYYNFGTYMRILNVAYTKLLNYLKETLVEKENVLSLYQEIHTNPKDSYLMIVLPKILKFPGSDDYRSPLHFFEKLVEYTNANPDCKNLKFRNKLMPREYNMQNNHTHNTITAYMSETEKMNKSMEPYRSIFRMADINLVTFDLSSGKIVDLRDKYYDTYVKTNISKKEIEQLVLDYIVGIEWLYQYYITGKHQEWSGWQYNHTQPPLIDDIIKYLESHENCQEKIMTILSSCPENTMTPQEHYLYVTPNEYTKANVSPNLSDVLHLIDGYGALYLNKCQIKWHEYE